MTFEANTETGSIRMYGVVGDWDGELQAQELLHALDQMGGRDVHILMKSPGGEVDEGISMYGHLAAYEGNVTVEIDAQAASIATVVMLAADTVLMRPHSQLFVHDPWSMVGGNEDELRAAADWLGKLGDDIATIYANKTGKPMADMRAMMKETMWFSTNEAIDFGLVDGLVVPPGRMVDEAAAELPKRFEPVARSKRLEEAVSKHRHRAAVALADSVKYRAALATIAAVNRDERRRACAAFDKARRLSQSERIARRS